MWCTCPYILSQVPEGSARTAKPWCLAVERFPWRPQAPYLQLKSPARQRTNLLGVNLVSGQRPEVFPGEDQVPEVTGRCHGLCKPGSCHLLPAPRRWGEVLFPALTSNPETKGLLQSRSLRLSSLLLWEFPAIWEDGWNRAGPHHRLSQGRIHHCRPERWGVVEVTRRSSSFHIGSVGSDVSLQACLAGWVSSCTSIPEPSAPLSSSAALHSPALSSIRLHWSMTAPAQATILNPTPPSTLTLHHPLPVSAATSSSLAG